MIKQFRHHIAENEALCRQWATEQTGYAVDECHSLRNGQWLINVYKLDETVPLCEFYSRPAKKAEGLG